MIPEDHSPPVTIAAQVLITTVMTKDLVFVSPDVSISVAAARMAEEGTGSCLVMDEGMLRGIITEQDLARKVVAGMLSAGETPVSRIMSSPVITIGAENTVGDAADLMVTHQIRRTVVEDDGLPIGIVTARDVLGFASRMNTILQEISGMYGTLMFLDHDMEVLWVNKQHEGGGTDGEGAVHCYELLHGSLRPCPGCPLFLSCDTSGEKVRTSEIIDRDHRIWQVQCHPVSWRGGAVIGVIESAIEVTNERELEQTLRDHQNQLHIAAESADVETWYCRADGKGMVFGSEGGVVFAPECRFSGIGELYGYLQPRLHPDDMRLLRAMVDGFIKGRKHSAEVRLRMLVPGGGWRWIRTVGRVIETAQDGTAVTIAGANIDITDLTNYRAAIQRVNKKLNLLASVTRHDVLNQVSAIMLAGELLEMDGYLDGGSELAENIGRILSSAGTIERQILFTKEYRGLGEADPEWQNVCLLVEKAADEFGPNLLSVTMSCACEGLEIYADPMFGHVLFNLIDNAIRHGVDTSHITIGFSDTRDGGRLIIEDDGRGVRDDIKEQIFARGYGHNTGLGLFLSREILDITGISIRECGEFGRGARFEMFIPHCGYRFV
ncbi:CBS domain-containing protein [Methanogenium organophilum]|uniref:CBS domain-containing protein n=1 Tax=Methanogenium organophilum TaxID=2199 RepID=A0A9X9S1F7_METOG|nr:CBS domain-containing protein [Methanogenium organophilum]WAI00119.1 CBS domain-containing protein [Methanogenium organophilum]